MATQTSIDFPDTCPYCKGRGVRVRVTQIRNRIIESVYPCRVCEAKGILAPTMSFSEMKTYMATAKVQLSLYGKFARP